MTKTFRLTFYWDTVYITAPQRYGFGWVGSGLVLKVDPRIGVDAWIRTYPYVDSVFAL